MPGRKTHVAYHVIPVLVFGGARTNLENIFGQGASESTVVPGLRTQNINKKCCKFCEYFTSAFTSSSTVVIIRSGT